MAFDFSSALQSGLTGAGAGSMFGPLGMALGGLGGALFGGFGGGQDQYNQLNPYSGQIIGDMQGRGTNLYNQFMAGVQDPNAGVNQFLSQAPLYQQMAQQNYNAFGLASDAQAQRRSQQAGDMIASKYGNLGAGSGRSGAALGAISQGMIDPLLQRDVQLSGMIGQQAGQLQGQGLGATNAAYMNALNQLGGAFNQNQAALAGLGDQVFAGNENFMSGGDISSLISNVGPSFLEGLFG